MGRPPVGGFVVPPGRTVAFRASTPANRRFHDRFGMQISDGHGRPRSCVGKVGSASDGGMAISPEIISCPLGAQPVEKTHPSVGSPYHEPVTIMRGPLLQVAHVDIFGSS